MRQKNKLLTMAVLTAILSVSCIGIIADSDKSDAATINIGIANFPTDRLNIGWGEYFGGYTATSNFNLRSFSTNYSWATAYISYSSYAGASVDFIFDTPATVGTFTISTNIPAGNFTQGAVTLTLTLVTRTPLPVTVSFNANGGTGTMSSMTIEEYTQIQLPISTFTPPIGSKFVGWKVENTGILLTPGGHNYVTANKTIYAQYEAMPSVTVSYNGNGADGATAPQTAQYGETVYLSPSGFTPPAGIHFTGWKLNNTGSLMQPGDPFTPTSNSTFYAQWENDPASVYHVISYDTGGLGSVSSQIVADGTSFTVKGQQDVSNRPSNIKLVNWTVQGTTTTLEPGTAQTPVSDMTLTANWIEVAADEGGNLILAFILLVFFLFLTVIAGLRFGLPGALITMAGGAVVILAVLFA